MLTLTRGRVPVPWPWPRALCCVRSLPGVALGTGEHHHGTVIIGGAGRREGHVCVQRRFTARHTCNQDNSDINDNGYKLWNKMGWPIQFFKIHKVGNVGIIANFVFTFFLLQFPALLGQ